MKIRLAASVWLVLLAPATVLASNNDAVTAPVLLTLPQAQALLLTHSRDLLVAQRGVASAKASQLSAAARPNPQLSINTVNINPHSVGAGSPYEKRMDTVLRIDQLIERGDKRDLRIKTAQQLELASEADLADITRQQRIALYNAYYDVAYAQEKIKLTADAAELATTAQKKAELRLSAGDIAAAEVARIRVDTLRAQNDAEQAVADAANARIALAYLLGLDNQAAQIQVEADWPATSDINTAADFDSLIARRADVQAAQARVDAARQFKELIRAQRTRDISVGAQVEHYPGATENTVGLGISFPLFLGNNFEGDIRNAEITLSSAEDNLERVRALALSELNRTRAALLNSQARLLRYQTSLLPAAHKAMNAAEFGFANGAISAVELLDARRTWRAIQLEALSAQSDYARSVAIWRTNTKIAQE
ncbi:TolC family protein [Sulfuriferula thiophila]|uniref:TolC family protein n=1 Tax=Sulfuriferula thiophila TaxID=1781211 RepID=UPI00167248E5|nr:TolC family protein [Sulfuriferula thiophila]